MNIVLLEPEIPSNTGNIARLCAATGTVLHLVGSLGFSLDDKMLKRAGMDYWQWVTWHHWKSWNDFLETVPGDAGLWYVESGGPKVYSEVTYSLKDYLVFGRETKGLPESLYQNQPERWLRIPMMNPQARSLNLSNCVALVIYHALAQNGFPGAI